MTCLFYRIHKEPKEGISGYKRNFKGGFEPKNYP